MKFDDEFTKALKQLPAKEKDKLILRLLKKDETLAKRLYFELVNTNSIEEKRAEKKEQIIEMVQKATASYYSPGYLLLDLRNISVRITDHVSVTKDKQGEIILNCLMLILALKLNNKQIEAAPLSKTHTFCKYVVARAFKILILIQKQHEDFHANYQDDIETLGQLISDNPLVMDKAIENGLNVNWLTRFEIPKNIAEIHKDLRKRGYLK